MAKNKTRSGYGLYIQRIQTIRTAMLVMLAVFLVSVPVPFIVRFRNRAGGERQELLRLWEAGAFDQAFSASTGALADRPMDYFLLTIRGFSAYQMGISQINSFDILKCIDECIWSLRKALLLKNAVNDGRVYYVLGKAYYYKGENYADLVIKYLEKARSLSYKAPDIPEYLGLAYAVAGDYRSSVAAFSEALQPWAAAAARPSDPARPSDAAYPSDPAHPSDVLLLSIARSYFALEEPEAAHAYLLRCLEVSPDSKTILAARLLFAQVLLKQGDAEGAEKQYTTILEETGENAEARYQLGELYAMRGDPVRARYEWNHAYRTDPAHAKARARLIEQRLLASVRY